ESKKRVRSATAFGQCNRNRLLRQSKVLFAHLTPGPLMGVDDLHCAVERPKMAGSGRSSRYLICSIPPKNAVILGPGAPRKQPESNMPYHQTCSGT
ncbi:hypothetical protein, partial [Paraburkholderia phenazinium]|uniref:hypothetical protein n=1 Tax=Paraburkholderia phenazinium TaxID=60549 RepID=UPI001ABA4586